MMAARSRTPSHEAFTPLPNTTDASQINRVYNSRPNSYMANNSIVPSDFQVRGVPYDPAPVAAQPSRFHEDFSSQRRSSSVLDGPIIGDAQRSDSRISLDHPALPSRGGTLKKKASLSKRASLRRGGSRRSSRAGSVRSMNLGEKEKYGIGDGDDANSAFYVPIPTTGSPTEVLANRFQAWRKVLKDLITFFRDAQKSYETRAKLFASGANMMNGISFPPTFLVSGGLGDASDIFKDYHKQAHLEANKARDVELEIIIQLTGLRNDLQQKIKEIKSLSGDFKNSVDKEVENTRKAVRHLQEALGMVDTDPSATSGKGDPFIVKMTVDKQLERQIDEENYLHQAFLNLEKSGRDLEAIVVGEIQKAYSAFASILKRDADLAYDAAEKLRDGPISMPKDHEWNFFISQTDHLIDPQVPVRNLGSITYPGKFHPAAAEVRSGMLERKSKYLKSYAPGWYVLSPTHLHEFKSADRLSYQSPVVSLYLPEQKLGSHSGLDANSHKFMLKGRQTGTLHRGHAWVFRAETHDTMLAWYEDIKNLTEKTGEARNAFVRRHARTLSGSHYRPESIDSEGAMEEDEADETPYSADHVMPSERLAGATDMQWQQRPQPGGRFPSDVQINRNMQLPHSPSSGEGSIRRDGIATHGGTFAEPERDGPFTDSHHDQIDSVAPRSNYSTSEKRYSNNYGEWIVPQRNPSQHDRHTTVSSSRASHNPQQLDRPPHRSESIASSTGAPITVARNETAHAPSGPETISPARTSGENKTSITNGTRATSVAADEDTGPKLGGIYADLTMPGPPARTSTDEMKFPGQYPGPQYI